MGKSKTEGLNHKLEFSPQKEWRAHDKDAFPSHNTKTTAAISPFKMTPPVLPHTIHFSSVPFRTSLLMYNHTYFAFWPYKLQNFKGVNMSQVAKSSIEQYSLSK